MAHVQVRFSVADATIERRHKPRLAGCFPALVRGRDPQGERVEVIGTVLNISAGGFLLECPLAFARGESLLLLVHLVGNQGLSGPRIVLRGRIVHGTRQRNARVYHLGASLRHYRILPHL